MALSRLPIGLEAMLFATQVAANRCEEMEREHRLVAQQLKRTKVCTTSKEVRGWTDCRFRAGTTEWAASCRRGRSGIFAT